MLSAEPTQQQPQQVSNPDYAYVGGDIPGPTGAVVPQTPAARRRFQALQKAINAAARKLGLKQRAPTDGNIGLATAQLAMLVADTVSSGTKKLPDWLQMVADASSPNSRNLFRLLAGRADEFRGYFREIAGPDRRWIWWSIGLFTVAAATTWFLMRRK